MRLRRNAFRAGRSAAAVRRRLATLPIMPLKDRLRYRFDDLMAYKRKDDEARSKVLDQLTAEAQELGMGY